MRFLETGKGAIAAALPKHLNPDRMLRLALTAFSTQPALRKCTGQSILASIVVASQLGLEPGVAGQGYLIPYKETCTFVPGWQGLVGLLNNTGRATAWTGVVFEGDEFDFQLGSAPKLRHVPGPNFGDSDKMLWAYACGKVNGSEQPVIEAWPMGRVWKHRDKNNKVGDRHYSFVHPEMYARKVVLLQVLKYMPRSIELNNAIVAADAAESGTHIEVVGGIIEPQPGDIEAETSAPNMAAGSAATRKATKEKAALFKGPASDPAPGAAEETPVKREPVKPSDALRNLAKGSRRSEMAVLAYLAANGHSHSTLDFAKPEVLQQMIEQWPDIYQDIEEDLDASGNPIQGK